MLSAGSSDLPEGINWLSIAKLANVPVTIEVDDSGMVRAASTELAGHTVTFAQLNEQPTISE